MSLNVHVDGCKEPEGDPQPPNDSRTYLCCPCCRVALLVLSSRWPTLWCPNCKEVWQWVAFMESWR
jgi:hypothetical protein